MQFSVITLLASQVIFEYKTNSIFPMDTSFPFSFKLALSLDCLSYYTGRSPVPHSLCGNKPLARSNKARCTLSSVSKQNRAHMACTSFLVTYQDSHTGNYIFASCFICMPKWYCSYCRNQNLERPYSHYVCLFCFKDKENEVKQPVQALTAFPQVTEVKAGAKNFRASKLSFS